MADSSLPGNLIVFEGPDGVGKTTLAKALTARLGELGIPCVYQSFPGQESGQIGGLVYGVQHDPEKFGIYQITPTALQALHIAAHVDAIESQILPKLRDGCWVVLDRFWWSTWVYGIVSGVSREALEAMVTLESLRWEDVKPRIVFLVERPIETAECEDSGRLKNEYSKLFDQEQSLYPASLFSNVGRLEVKLEELLEHLKDLLPQAENEVGNTQMSLFGDRQSANSSVIEMPEFFSTLSPAKPTVVYDAFWKFAAERQKVFFRKLEGFPAPWTDDPVIAHYKFTNAYRASDRVSQYLIRRVIYEGDTSPEEVFFRTILFKLFNKIETWELLRNKIGSITSESYSFERYDEILSEAVANNVRIYSGAYIMPSGKSAFGYREKRRTHLRLLERMMEDEVPLRVANAQSMAEIFECLLSYPTIGTFLGYQFATDLNYSEICDFSEMEFVYPGPGAFDGIHKCFSDLGGLAESDIIRLVTDHQEKEFDRLGLHFRSLWGRPLQLIDSQNLFCEVSKYARVMHPDVAGVSGRVRIKQVYRPSDRTLEVWYPPKWGINDLIPGKQSGDSVA